MFDFFKKNKIALEEDSLLMRGFSYELATKFAKLTKEEFIDELSKVFTNFQPVSAGKPYVHMFVGSNGVGKSSTIGKVANLLKSHKLLLVAGDTFRAAATEQLRHYADLLDIPILAQHQNAEPASVVFDGIKKGADMDYVLVDTSGRLNTKTHLLAELQKVCKVAEKANGGKPIPQISLVLDATNGLHLLSQVEDFLKYVPITDLIFTKTDNDKNLGAIVNVISKFQIPISYLCFGEKLECIEKFDKEPFIQLISEQL